MHTYVKFQKPHYTMLKKPTKQRSSWKERTRENNEMFKAFTYGSDAIHRKKTAMSKKSTIICITTLYSTTY